MVDNEAHPLTNLFITLHSLPKHKFFKHYRTRTIVTLHFELWKNMDMDMNLCHHGVYCIFLIKEIGKDVGRFRKYLVDLCAELRIKLYTIP